jgi:molybdate transport system substrate-binding protein
VSASAGRGQAWPSQQVKSVVPYIPGGATDTAGRVVAGSKTDLARSAVALAVRAGASRPTIDTETALREAVQSARTIGFSTGPSGVALQQLFERCIAEVVRPRGVRAAGVPVVR